ncbi:SLATT domain-containing protein [Bradyrhizobium ottawaense]|uniref:SLATT domain-containing protein n=1 Tax=Bradyrhizobium ottawaense TaxID=931866 RepID=UPI001BAA5DBE|nr:SLATT domain-containing protein [Bradyrhizobium ottawaense]MBR1329894.1 SLATT domain-containing protein [Bradyrhizobium ottawaense]
MAASIPVDDERYVLESQIRELYGRCAYTHKTHEKMAERASTYLWRVKWTQIILSALTTGGAIGVVFDANSAIYPLATAALSILMLIVNSYVKDIDPGQDAQLHRDAASDIWNVREAYLSLLTDIRDLAFSLDDIRKRRDELQGQLHLIYKAAPHTNAKAYSQAQDALQKNEDLTFTDAEIDAFLPSSLKRARST